MRERRIILNVALQLVALVAQLVGNGELVAVGTAAYEHDVRRGQVEHIAHVHVVNLDGNAPPPAAAFEDDGIAAIAVQVQGVGIEVDDAQRTAQVEHLVRVLGVVVIVDGRYIDGHGFRIAGHDVPEPLELLDDWGNAV